MSPPGRVATGFSKVVVVGVSQGGHAATLAGARLPHVSCVVSLIGCPDYGSLMRARFDATDEAKKPPRDVALPSALLDLTRRMDAAHSPEAFDGKWFLAASGAADTLVPGTYNAAFVEALHARGRVGRAVFTTEPGVGHRVSPAMVDATASFVKVFLGAGGGGAGKNAL